MTKESRTETPALRALLDQVPLAPLGPGTPVSELRGALSAGDEALFGVVKDGRMARACRAGLWLAFGFLDESHAISQELETPEGSFWHAILHRREPDFANSKYWFRRVGRHPLYEELARDAAELGYLGMGMSWDPFAFVDSCQEHGGEGGEAEETLRRVQRAEWGLLFEWCRARVRLADVSSGLCAPGCEPGGGSSPCMRCRSPT